MMTVERFQEIIAAYQRHGWRLRRVLLRSETRASLDARTNDLIGDAVVIEEDFDAMWFARPSHAGREAWELRMVAEQPYALFEAFEADETEEEREETRREMEARTRDYLKQA